MRIKRLILQNINSLYGKWEIDFDAPEFQAGIFAVTGKTGSGKTSILDAVCLALYAETPRLSGTARTEAVSKGAEECLAEVTFALEGHDYTASFAWSIIRRGARKGQLQDRPLHKLCRDGREIASGLEPATRAIEELLGLNKEQFCRAVLLAQGHFDAFLAAKDRDRAEILEQITGTEIYSRIAAGIAERSSAEKNRLDLLAAECAGLETLPDETVAELTDRLAECRIRRADLTAQAEQTDSLIRTFDRLTLIRNDLAANAAAREALARDIVAFAPDRVRLDRAERARRTRDHHDRFQQLDGEQKQDLADLERRDEARPDLVRKRDEARQAAESAAAIRNAKRDEAIEETTDINRARALDRDIAAVEKERTSDQSALDTENQRATELAKNRLEREREMRRLEEERRIAETYLAEHPGDDLLPEKRADWLARLNGLRELAEQRNDHRQEITCLRTELARAIQEETSLQTDADRLRRAAEPLTAKIAALTAKRNTLLAGNTPDSYREKRDLLVRNLFLTAKVQSLETERKYLVHGQPCPLCGSLEHPYAAGCPPETVDEQWELDRIDALLKQLDTLDSGLSAARAALDTAKEECRTTETELQVSEATTADRTIRLNIEEKNLARLENDGATAHAALVEEWAALGIAPGPDDPPDILPHAVGERIRLYAEHTNRLRSFQQKKQRTEAALTALDALAGEVDHRKEELTNRVTAAARQADSLRTSRRDCFGDRDPETEAQALAGRLQTVENTFHQAGERKAAADAALVHADRERTELQARIGRRAEPLRSAEDAFRKACAEQGFSPGEFDSFHLPDDVYDALSKTAGELEARERRLTQEQTVKSALEAETAARLPAEVEETSLRTGRAELAQQQEEIVRNITEWEGRLSRDAEVRRKAADGLEKLRIQQDTARRWSTLHELIGKGNQFQRIAQGITLDRLLTLANGKMKRFSDRYELVRDPGELLGLDVIDRDQGGLVRPCVNLSGGERFLASLALALGLSGMAGEKIRIDTLFLDEGFGSLDAESLQQAMHTLGNLRADGKLVGIITHVAEVPELLDCVIEVNAQPGGRGTLSGPGVRERNSE